MKVGVLSVVPSPYQRDFFRALAGHPGIDLEVAYLEDAAPDSPWPKKPLEEYETLLPGRTLGRGRVRCHSNSRLPDPHRFDAYIVNTALTALTTQRMFRRLKGHPNWFFWGEVLRTNGGLKGAIQRRLSAPLGRARAIVAIGSRARTDYQARFPASPVEQIPYLCDLSEFRPRPRPDAPPTFLFCGQMIERKGVDLLVQVFRRLEQDGVAARLLLAGRETSLIGELPGNVEMVGFQAPDRLPELFERADVFVLPSRHDGWGVVINQAIGAGLPIIASTAVGAAIDLVEPGVNGLQVEPGELDSLERAIRQLAGDHRARQRMSVASTQLASQLAPGVGAERWYQLLQCASS